MTPAMMMLRRLSGLFYLVLLLTGLVAVLGLSLFFSHLIHLREHGLQMDGKQRHL